MPAHTPLLEIDQIVVGQPLPFSIFTVEGKLLLAEGRIVATEHARGILLRSGTHRSAIQNKQSAPRPRDMDQRPVISPLTTLHKAYRAAGSRRRFALTLARDGTSEAFRTNVVGVHEDIIVVDAPSRPNGSLAVVSAGQVWLCRTFELVAAFRFPTTVLKVAFEPFPHLHLSAPSRVERRKVRDRTRVVVLVDARLQSHASAPCLLVDLSLSGGRIATDNLLRLEREQSILITLQLELLERTFDLSLDATVISAFGASDSEHPRVLFYGIKFQSLTQLQLLVLHGFLSSHLALELNALWQVLSRADSSAD